MTSDEIRKKFEETVKAHGKEVVDAWARVIELSEKYGIPFGTYLPKSFMEKFRYAKTFDADGGIWEQDDGVTLQMVIDLCSVDEEHWLSSTFSCNDWYGW